MASEKRDATDEVGFIEALRTAPMLLFRESEVGPRTKNSFQVGNAVERAMITRTGCSKRKKKIKN
jgi:hypothetical protein